MTRCRVRAIASFPSKLIFVLLQARGLAVRCGASTAPPPAGGAEPVAAHAPPQPKPSAPQHRSFHPAQHSSSHHAHSGLDAQKGYGTAPLSTARTRVRPTSTISTGSRARWADEQQVGAVLMSSGRDTGIDFLHVQRCTVPPPCRLSETHHAVSAAPKPVQVPLPITMVPTYSDPDIANTLLTNTSSEGVFSVVQACSSGEHCTQRRRSAVAGFSSAARRDAVIRSGAHCFADCCWRPFPQQQWQRATIHGLAAAHCSLGFCRQRAGGQGGRRDAS